MRAAPERAAALRRLAAEGADVETLRAAARVG
jgi:hypothetical protein